MSSDMDHFFRTQRRAAISQHETQIGIDYVEYVEEESQLKLYFIPAAEGVENFCILSGHKLVIPAMRAFSATLSMSSVRAAQVTSLGSLRSWSSIPRPVRRSWDGSEAMISR